MYSMMWRKMVYIFKGRMIVVIKVGLKGSVLVDFFLYKGIVVVVEIIRDVCYEV